MKTDGILSRLTDLRNSHGLYWNFLTHLEYRGATERTLETYGDVLRVLDRFLLDEGLDNPCHVSADDLCDFQAWLFSTYRDGTKPLSPARHGTYVAVVRSLYDFLAQEGKVLKSPALGLQSPKLARRIHRDILNPEELKRLLSRPDRNNASGLRDEVILHILSLSGLRVTELCQLDCENVNPVERELIVRKGKGRKDRLTFISTSTRKVLELYLKNARPVLVSDKTPALFINNQGNRIAPYEVRALLKQYASQARIAKHLTPHSLRRTFCTLLLQFGMNLKAIADLAGHASLKTTAKYTKVDIAELKAVYQIAHPRCGD
jgi:integrase/recombinase XerD